MALSVVNNNASLNAQQNLNRTSSALSKSLERLSTGLKINRGADGPAGLVISEQQRAQIAGLTTAIDNSNKAVSLVQTAEGALNELNTLLTKARGLALDSANSGVQDSAALAANQAEITNALSTINNIANTTKFGSNKYLLNGQSGVLPTAITNNSTLGQLKAGPAATLGDQTIAVGAAGGGSLAPVVAATQGAINTAAPITGAFVTGTVTTDAAAAAVLATDTLTISGGGVTSPITITFDGTETLIGTATVGAPAAAGTIIDKIQTQLNAAAAGKFLVTGSTAGITVSALSSNSAVTVASNSVTAAALGFLQAGSTGAPGAATLTLTGGGLRAGGLAIDVSGVTTANNLQSTVQTALDEATGAGNFVVGQSGGKLTIVSKLSSTAISAQSGNASTAAFTGVGTTLQAGTAGATLDNTNAANGNATGGRGVGAADLGTGTLSTAGSLTVTGGGLSTSLVVGLNAGDSAATVISKVQAALDNASATGGGAGKFTVSGTAGSTGLTIQSNVLGSAAITIKADSATTTTLTGVSNASADQGTAGNALAVFVGTSAATVAAGSQGLGNAVTFGGADGLSFNVGVTGGKATSSNNNVVNVTDNSLSFQIGANAGEFSKISIDKVTADRLGSGVSGLNNVATTDLSKIDVTTSNGAQDAIKIIDQAITDVSTIRAKLGAFQTNSLESNTNSLRNTLENTTAAQSVIRDTDFASEIANFTRLQTQQQAGATVLGNANQTTALVAQLLRG